MLENVVVFMMKTCPINCMRSTEHWDLPDGSLALIALYAPSEIVSAVELKMLEDGVGDALYSARAES